MPGGWSREPGWEGGGSECGRGGNGWDDGGDPTINTLTIAIPAMEKCRTLNSNSTTWVKLRYVKNYKLVEIYQN